MTFSFRLNEKEFKEDLQSFAKFFRSVEEDLSLERVKPLDKASQTYFNFDLSYKVPESELTLRKFKNPEPDSVKKDLVYFAGKNLWILKPSGLNRGKGLELFSSLKELSGFLKLYTTGYEVKEFITMQYSDSDTTSPSLVKSPTQQKLESSFN